MGQKTHPIGFRLGFTKTWNAKWFANKKNYPVLLKEDIGIRNAIRASDRLDLTGGSVFRKGDTVVHPEHGAAVIEELRDREFLGEKRKYLVLRVAYGDLTLMVPVDSTDEVGLRQVVSKSEVKKVLKVLTEDESSMAANWSRRFKNNMEKLHSGDPYQVAEVLRNLAIREREKGLSAGEKRMIQKARQILISELHYATGNSEEEAEAMIDDVLEKAHGGRVPAEL